MREAGNKNSSINMEMLTHTATGLRPGLGALDLSVLMVIFLHNNDLQETKKYHIGSQREVSSDSLKH